MSHKVIVVGDVNGQLSDVFQRLKALHAKQNFAFAIIAGNLFADPAQPSLSSNEDLTKLLEGKIDIALPTYFTLAKQALPQQVIDELERNNGELAPNLTCMGRRTRIKTSDGITILNIGGVRKDSQKDQPLSIWSSEYVDKDVFQALSFNDVDILITSDWPTGVTTGSSVPCAGPATEDVESLARLCSGVRPRYYFSTSAAFFEREPFYHDSESKARITRFIALAPYGNASKEKYIYAFTLNPLSSNADDQAPPGGTTASPLAHPRKRKLESQQNAFNSYRFSDSKGSRENHGGKRRRNAAPPQPQQCYFCLSNPACETHMIGSIGNDAYVTVAKGPLTTRSTFTTLDFPGHLLIIPLIHAPTIASIPDRTTRDSTAVEMRKYLAALHAMVVSRSKAEDEKDKLGSVTWDINRSSGVHNHWQFLPMPAALIDSGVIEATFKSEADAQDYPAFQTEQEEVEELEKGDHFKVITWSGDESKIMVMPLDQSFRFDLQFARRVLGKLLGIPDRANWKDCGQTKSDEEADTLRFKEVFKQHDFSLEN